MKENDEFAPRLSDADFVRALEDGSLPAPQFDHVGHLRYAWLLLCQQPLPEVLLRAETSIRRFATQHGAPEKYHQTVTWTYILALHHLMVEDQAQPGNSLQSLLRRFPALLEPVPQFMSRFYAKETWTSEPAVARYVLPDRLRRGLAA